MTSARRVNTVLTECCTTIALCKYYNAQGYTQWKKKTQDSQEKTQYSPVTSKLILQYYNALPRKNKINIVFLNLADSDGHYSSLNWLSSSTPWVLSRLCSNSFNGFQKNQTLSSIPWVLSRLLSNSFNSFQKIILCPAEAVLGDPSPEDQQILKGIIKIFQGGWFKSDFVRERQFWEIQGRKMSKSGRGNKNISRAQIQWAGSISTCNKIYRIRVASTTLSHPKNAKCLYQCRRVLIWTSLPSPPWFRICSCIS